MVQTRKICIKLRSWASILHWIQKDERTSHHGMVGAICDMIVNVDERMRLRLHAKLDYETIG